MSSVLGAILFGIIAVMTLLVTLGMPLGEYTLGGKYKVLPSRLRIASGISFFIQLLAIIAVLQTARIITTGIPFSVARGLCFFFAAYLSINVFMNLFSKSNKEKYVMTPLSIVAATCFWITAISS
ncbi:hypothetical protein ACPWSR_01950 [Alloiococcus sp. CFN-8]|uniref:hypothetical protein n=1 Tax=Alloiococcus sp. CFN-8 TaxID=3416081 RepID=UPI003CEEE148